MRNSRFSFNRCLKVMAVLLVSSFFITGFAGCKTNDDGDDAIKNLIASQQFILAQQQARVGKPTPIQATDGVCGSWAGSGMTFDIAENFYGSDTVSNCQKVDSENFHTITYTNARTNEKIILDKKNSNKVYVVFNDITMKSGVLLFQAKFSAYGSPAEGCFYGIKFELKDGNKAWFEAGYNSSLNNISDLNEACEKLAFGNNDYYNPSYWTETNSGVTKQN